MRQLVQTTKIRSKQSAANLINIRFAREDDESFIYKSWLVAYKAAKPNHKIRNQVYFENQKQVIKSILARSNTIIACDLNDSSNCYAYLCAEAYPESIVLHWVYTKFRFRHFGIAEALLDFVLEAEPKAQLYASHIGNNNYVDRLVEKHQAIYDPSLTVKNGTS